MDIFKYFLNTLKTKTITHFIITSSGTVVNGLLGLAFYVLAARILGPTNFGILGIAIATIALIADVGDLGVDTGIIRFLGKYYKENEGVALKFLKLAFTIKTLVWVLVLFLGFWIAPFIAQNIFLKPELELPLKLSLVGVGGSMLFSLVLHSVQALQKFWVWNFLNITSNGIRLLVVIILATLSFSNTNNILITYITVTFLGAFLGLIFLPNFLSVNKPKEVLGEFVNYSKWVAILGIITASSARLDVFISTRLLSITQVGFYTAANQLSSFVPQIVFALATVVAPKLARFQNQEEVIVYLKKLQLLVTGIFLVGLLLLPIASLAFPFIYGEDYLPSQVPFILLVISQLIFLLALPAHQTIFYYFAKPYFFVLVSIGQLIITAGLGWILISNLGILGAALTVLIGSIYNLLFTGSWVLYKFHKRKKL